MSKRGKKQMTVKQMAEWCRSAANHFRKDRRSVVALALGRAADKLLEQEKAIMEKSKP